MYFLVGAVQTCIILFLPLLLQAVHGVSPIFISFVSIVFSFGWTVGTFMVTGWSGARERVALWSGPIVMTAGLAVMTATTEVAGLVVLTISAGVIGFGIGIHNVHLAARTIAGAREGEEGLTAAALPSFRALGTAFGAAAAGMLSTLAGLTDAMEKAAVGEAITIVYGANLVPSLIVVVFMFKMVALEPRGGGRGTMTAALLAIAAAVLFGLALALTPARAAMAEPRSRARASVFRPPRHCSRRPRCWWSIGAQRTWARWRCSRRSGCCSRWALRC